PSEPRNTGRGARWRRADDGSGSGSYEDSAKKGQGPRRRQVCRKRRQRTKKLMLDVCVGWKTAQRFPPQIYLPADSSRGVPAKDQVPSGRVDSCASMAALSMTERTSTIRPSLNA